MSQNETSEGVAALAGRVLAGHEPTREEILSLAGSALAQREVDEAAKFYIVWNGARNEGFVTEDESDAIAAVTGRPHYDLGMPTQSTIGEAFHEAYGDDPVTLEEITITVDAVRGDVVAFDGDDE
jgi:hypothetical protein